MLRVQDAYPKIYLACHSRHQTSRTNVARVSQRDASILSHLNERHPVSQSELVEHLALAKSTVSEALRGLEESGFVTRIRDKEDSRGSEVLRTLKGSAVMSAGSVLEAGRLQALLSTLSAKERELAVVGLELLAKVAERVEKRSSKKRSSSAQVGPPANHARRQPSTSKCSQES